MIFEHLFPGNATTMARLIEAFAAGGVTAFTGAGTSMPALPAWVTLVKRLVVDAANDGKLESADADTLVAEQNDFLYVIDEVYNFAGKSQTKSKVAKIFRDLQQPTDAHKLITETSFDRVLTLNYDNGLEMAHAELRRRHVRSITAVHTSEVDQWLRHDDQADDSPILHWHGSASDASSIILSGSDYVDFYEQSPQHRETLRSIFKNRRVLMIGFGFSDPFIERELNLVMQPQAVGNAHFAIIGVPEEKKINIVLERRKYTSKYKLEVLFYPVSSNDGVPDHSALLEVLQHLKDNSPALPSMTENAATSVTVLNASSTESTLSSSLFTVGDRTIYCEPNIWLADLDAGNPTLVRKSVSLPEIINSDTNSSITAPHEYGLTNLGRRIVSEVSALGTPALFCNAHDMPKYRKAILKHDGFIDRPLNQKFVVVIDNYISVDHQRLVRELLSTYENIRIIVLQRNSASGSIADGLEELNFASYELSGLSRKNIRHVVSTIRPSLNTDQASALVDKIYSDLIQLSIPFTPSNVIMYSSVLCKDDSFSPVSRLHIVDRFVSEALRRSSDVYADSFNSINKTDLISAFCAEKFEKGQGSFTEPEWVSFCVSYKKENLVEFSAVEVLGDLLNGRIVVKDGSNFVFRYRMFFSYFVGKHIASQSELLIRSIANNKHLELDGLVEVLCGSVHDASIIIEDLTYKFGQSIDNFYQSYPIRDLDFHEEIKWEYKQDEDKLWTSVAEGLERGPANSEELDTLKTSIQAEQRTVDQKVSIIKFIASEQSVSAHAHYLKIALESAKQANAEAKKSAARALISASTLAYEVATVFIPLIAEKKYVSWNGFTYINLIENFGPDNDNAEQDAEREHMREMVAYSLPTSMGKAGAEHFGSRKLGPVYLALAEDGSISTSIKQFILYCLLLRSKPASWLSMALKTISSMKRDDIYLRHMLAISVNQFRVEVNTEDERQSLKDVVAAIRLRRDANVKVLSAAEIRKTVGRLDSTGYFKGLETGE